MNKDDSVTDTSPLVVGWLEGTLEVATGLWNVEVGVGVGIAVGTASTEAETEVGVGVGTASTEPFFGVKAEK